MMEQTFPQCPTPLDGRVEQRISRVISAMAAAIQQVLDRLPGAPHRPQELATLLNLNKTLSSRLLHALRLPDPLAAAHPMPGPEGLRILLKAAGRKGVPRELVQSADEAVNAFEQLIRRDIGSRDGLDAIISDSLPHARGKFEMANKQALFRANANLKGVVAELQLATVFLWPSEQPERHDGVFVSGALGLRRLRPGAAIQFSHKTVDPTATTDRRLTLDGQPVESLHGQLIEPFCSKPLPEITARREGLVVNYQVADAGIGPDTAIDIVYADVVRGAFRRHRVEGGPRIAGNSAVIEQPVKTLVFDMLLHEDVWPGCEPKLWIYDTAIRGGVDPNDPARQGDRLDLAEQIQFLGRGLRKFRSADIPNYLDMMQHVCGRMGWSPDSLRGFRCRIQYPPYGSQVCMVYEPPQISTSYVR